MNILASTLVWEIAKNDLPVLKQKMNTILVGLID